MKGWGSGNIGAAKITRPHSAVSGGLVFLLRPNTTTLLRPKVTNNCALVAWRNWHFANSTSPARSHLSTGCAMVQTMMPRQRDYGWRSQVEAEDNCRDVDTFLHPIWIVRCPLTSVLPTAGEVS